MGSPISPILALIVMDFVLDIVIPSLSFQLPFIYKFVDDIITCIPSDNINDVLSIFNGYNKHIQFTIEVDENSCLPFLDCKLLYDDFGSLKIDWYTKPTYSGRYIHFQSNQKFSHKINTVIGMKNRILKICSPCFQLSALNKLKNVFVSNGYPGKLLN